MRLQFWGVRGSIPAPGCEFNRYGGNTACIALETDAKTMLILDAGTGMIGLGRVLMGGKFGKGSGAACILLTHAHWDHIQGFPFFQPAFVPGNQLTIVGSCGSSEMLEGILEGQMNPHFNPVQSLRNLGSAIRILDVEQGAALPFDDVRIVARSVPHGHISSLAFRIEADGQTLVYVPDAGYRVESIRDEVWELYRGADCLIHDCTYTPEDRADRQHRGYCSIDIAARIAARSRVGRLVMFHYDQDYTDRQVDTLGQRCRELLDREPGGDRVALTAAAEGASLVL